MLYIGIRIIFFSIFVTQTQFGQHRIKFFILIKLFILRLFTHAEIMYDKYKNIGGGIRQETRGQNTKIKKETNLIVFIKSKLFLKSSTIISTPSRKNSIIPRDSDIKNTADIKQTNIITERKIILKGSNSIFLDCHCFSFR